MRIRRSPNESTPAREGPDQKSASYFESIWRKGDYWQLETSPFEQAKYLRQRELIADRRYGRALEIGCGAVLSETIYYVGWLYSFFDVCWLVHQLFEATSQRGRLLMTNTCGGPTGYLLLPGIIQYRDLMLNVQYTLEHEETFTGTKDGAELDVLISLFTRLAGKDEPK
jgi:hypothetical protein